MLSFFKNSEFKNGVEKVISGQDIELVEPKLVRNKLEDQYYQLHKEPARFVNLIATGLTERTSQKLYDIDTAIWKELVVKRLSDEEHRANLHNVNFISIENEIVTVLSTDRDFAMSKFFDHLRSLESKNYEVLYKYHDHIFDAVVFNKESCDQDLKSKGLLIQLVVPWRTLSVWPALIKFGEHKSIETIIPFPKPEASGQLSSDFLASLGDLAEMIESSNVEETVKYLHEDLQCRASVAEVFNYFKAVGLVKGKNIRVEAEAQDSTLKILAVRMLAEELDRLNIPQYLKGYPYLKKATTITQITFGKILSIYSQLLVSEETPRVNQLADLVNYALSNSPHIKQINSV